MENINPIPGFRTDAATQALSPAFEAILERSNYPGRRLAAAVAQQHIGQTDLGKRIAAAAMRNQLPRTAYVSNMLRQLHIDVHNSFARVAIDVTRQQPAFAELAASLTNYQNSIQRSIQASGLGQAWLDRIATSLYSSPLDGQLRDQMADFLDEVYDTLDEGDEAPELDTDVGSLDEITAQGMAFVASEGTGLSWEAQRRLLAWFVGLAVFGVLMQAIVMNDAVKDVLDDAAVPASIAAAAMVVTRQEFDRRNPRPRSEDEEGDGEPGA
jgi:hypothetical protein